LFTFLRSGDRYSCSSRTRQSGHLPDYDDRPLPVREWLPAYAQWLNASPPAQVLIEDALQIGGADAVYYGAQMRFVN
jgi:hypothetical protein